MRYPEAAEYLLDLRRFRMRPGTASTAELLSYLGDPQDPLAAVQIAGSNGKGSTARMVESVLDAAGYDVGRYTSPHLETLRDRVAVDGRPVRKETVAAFVETVRDHVDDRAAAGDPPTFFEAMTALALWSFERADCDVAVLEVGIGGRHDATSAVDPVASAVTAVAREHTDVLGEDLAGIARDLASVATDDRPLVTGASGDALAAIRESTDVVTVGPPAEGPDTETEPPAVTARYGGVRDLVEAAVELAGPGDAWTVDTRLPLPGAHQAVNAGVAAALCRQVADALGDAPPDDGAVERGLRGAHWPGRFEVVERSPLAILDGAHNEAACAALAETLAEYEADGAYDELTLVVGAMNDKDHAAMAAALPAADRVLISRPALDRAESRSVLARAFRRSERHGAVEDAGAVPSAVETALADAEPGDCVLVTGSLYTVAEAREHWTRLTVPKRVGDLDDARAVLDDAGVSEPGTWRMRGKGVHRVLRTSLRPTQAQYLKEELLSLGGECAIAGGGDRDAHEPVEVVCMGTLAQFRRLVGKLGGQPYGLDVVGGRLADALGIDAGADAGGRATGSTGGAGRGRPADDAEWPWQTPGTAVMGIVNVTPDSFHDGGAYDTTAAAVERAAAMVDAGADLIDVGGESTNPSADPTPADVELERILPVVEELADRDLDATVTVDTRKADVAAAALDAGAEVINDVSGLADPAMRFVAADRDAPVVIMHSVTAPVDPDSRTDYDDVVEDVIAALGERIRLAEQAGLDRERIVVDPGLGFGKSAAESWQLLSRLEEFRALDCPLLVGHSRKSMFGAIDRYPDEGGYATVAASALAAERGADVLRVHDVAENVGAVRAAGAVDAGRVGGDCPTGDRDGGR